MKMAEEMQMDPSQAASWKRVNPRQVCTRVTCCFITILFGSVYNVLQGGGGLLSMFNGSLHEALKQTFLEWNFEFNCMDLNSF